MHPGRSARAAWTAALLVGTVGPILALVTAPTSTALVIFTDATGLAAVSSVLAALVLSARLRSLTTTLGLERVSASHRYLGYLATAETAAHVVLAVVGRTGGLRLLSPLQGSDAARAGLAAFAALIVLAATAPLRTRGHEAWRVVHLAATVALVVGVALHVLWLDHLIATAMLGAWFEGAAGLAAVVLAYRWLWRPTRESAAYTVREVRRETDSVSTLVLTPHRGRHREGPRTLEFEPGQFAWLRLSRMGGEEHPYSMSGTAHSASTLEFTMRHTGNFTDQLADLKPGRTVYLDGPHGTFTPTEDAPGLVLIASGVGMTPILSILRTLADRGDKRLHRLIVTASAPDQLLFSDEIEALRARLNLEVTATIHRKAPGWTGRVGVVDGPLLATVLPGPPVRDQFVYFVCGPPLLVTEALSALRILRVPTSQIRTERFDSNLRGRRNGHTQAGPAHRADGSAGDTGRGRPGSGAHRIGVPDRRGGADGGRDRG